MLRNLYPVMTEIAGYRWSGKLCVINSVAGLSWELFFSMGRLVWIDGGVHPRRRFRRYLKSLGILSLTECRTPETRLQSVISVIRSQYMGCQDLQQFLHNSAREIFFDIGQACSTSLQRDSHGEYSWHENARPNQDFLLLLGWGVDARRGFEQGRQDWLQWSKLKFAQHSPDTTPEIFQEAALADMLPPKFSERIQKLFSSKRTLRDIANQMRWQPPELAAFVHPLLRKGYIRLEASPDYGESTLSNAFRYLGVNGSEFEAPDLRDL